jgi:hypothetical protein
VRANSSSTAALWHMRAVLNRLSGAPLAAGALLGGIPSGLLLFHLGLAGQWHDRFFIILTLSSFSLAP